MKKMIALAGIALAIPLAFTLLLKALHLMQGIISKMLSALLWCLSAIVVMLLLQKKLTGRRCR
jgi:hypothetical protein